jgi:hypothetical protein
MAGKKQPRVAARPKSKQPTAPPAAELPEWVTDTPRELEYGLEVFAYGDGCIQSIDMTRAEYLTLKATLAKLRGYEVAGQDTDAA